jgi:iron complex transport system substrate-binding protein
VIAPARLSWVNEIVRLAGGVNPFGSREGKSVQVSDDEARGAGLDAIVMSWCGVKEEKYRRDVVERRPGWSGIPAVQHGRIVPITEAFLGRPGPRLAQGYRALAELVASVRGRRSPSS